MASKSQDSPSLPERRIVLVGKTGSGKSSLGNTLFGEKVFCPDHTSKSGTVVCLTATKKVMNKQLTLIDTPGLFDTDKSEEDLKSEIISSIVECAPEVHAFLVVLKVEKFTKHEEEVVTRIFQYFSEEVLKYSVIIFTNGDQLPEGTNIQQFVDHNQKLKDVVRKCDGRCHVFDSKYWKNNNPKETYRSNSYQLEELLITVENLVISNNGGIYTNEMLQEIDNDLLRLIAIGVIYEVAQKMIVQQLRVKLRNLSHETLVELLLGRDDVAFSSRSAGSPSKPNPNPNPNPNPKPNPNPNPANKEQEKPQEPTGSGCLIS